MIIQHRHLADCVTNVVQHSCGCKTFFCTYQNKSVASTNCPTHLDIINSIREGDSLHSLDTVVQKKPVHYAAMINERFRCGSRKRQSAANTWHFVTCPDCLELQTPAEMLRAAAEDLNLLANSAEKAEAERDALEVQVAAVKALEPKRSLGLFPHGAAKVEGWNECIDAVRAAQSGLA